MENHRRKRADQALELEKGVKRKPGSGRIARKSVEVVDHDTNETKYFPSLSEACKYFGKTKIYFIYNNGRVWENKKITIINHSFVISTRILIYLRIYKKFPNRHNLPAKNFYIYILQKWTIPRK